MSSPRTLLGPLTTTWTPGPICSYAMALCDTCTTVWYAQTCNPQVNAHDYTDCWPPRSGEQTTINPGVMMGWGFYSPGVYCPAGYTTAAMATAGGSSGWPIEYSLTDGETAAACCPTGYGISTISVSNTLAQTCVLTATTSSFISVQCAEGQFTEFATIHIPATVSDVVLSKYTLFAPLYQLNFRAEDIPATQTTTTPGAGAGTSQTSTSASSTSRLTTTIPGTTLPSTTIPAATITTTPGADGSGSASSGLSSSAKIGIGVGAAVGSLLLLVIAFLLWRLRRRDLPKKTEEAGAGMLTKEDSTKKAMPLPDAELGGTEVKELDGRPVHAELPTQQPSHRIPPEGGPMFRRSDQNWVISPTDGTLTAVDGLVSPVEPHHGAVFELDGESTPRSNRSTFERARR